MHNIKNTYYILSNSRTSRRGCNFLKLETQSENYAFDEQYIKDRTQHN